MDIQEKVDKDYLKAFNLGYEVAKELNLKSPMFKNQNIDETTENPVHAGMFQFIKESSQNLGITFEKSSENKILEIDPEIRAKRKNRGKGLTP